MQEPAEQRTTAMVNITQVLAKKITSINGAREAKSTKSKKLHRSRGDEGKGQSGNAKKRLSLTCHRLADREPPTNLFGSFTSSDRGRCRRLVVATRDVAERDHLPKGSDAVSK
jgi:hypothetical protein